MNWLLLRGLGREQRHWYDFPERLRALVAPEPVFLLDLAGTGTERARLPVPSVPWLARDIACRAAHLHGLQRERQAGVAGDPVWCLLGLSLGGMVALELCALWRQRVAHAMIINSSARITRPTARLQPQALQALARALLARDALAREQHVLALTSHLPAAERHSYAERNAALAADGAPRRRALASQLCAAARFSPPRAASVAARLCFLGSGSDRLVSAACSRALAAHYGAPYLEHPWAGHDLPLDDPGWIFECVARIRQPADVT
jgi:pimeloyl-ACP methyl ester carboxylesterase